MNYAGVVKARNEVFVTQGLTPQTHYIASTGIGGRHADTQVLVQMDTYAVLGIRQEQIHYLYAPTHLNPTYEYGVSFERGTYVDYGDRRQVFISGTASINHRGEVVHPGDIRKQTERMWENVETLLKEAEMSFDDIGQMLVYLRDAADYAVVRKMFDQRFPEIPKVILLAPVCRPGWLIEMECMGTKMMKHTQYPDFSLYERTSVEKRLGSSLCGADGSIGHSYFFRACIRNNFCPDTYISCLLVLWLVGCAGFRACAGMWQMPAVEAPPGLVVAWLSFSDTGRGHAYLPDRRKRVCASGAGARSEEFYPDFRSANEGIALQSFSGQLQGGLLSGNGSTF